MSADSIWLRLAAVMLCGMAFITAQAEDLTLLETPIKVTATLRALDEGGYAAQISIHNGNITQLVSTTLANNTASTATTALRRHVLWQAPYLFVHSSCGGGRRCDGEVVFKVVDDKVTRLGDLIGTTARVFKNGYFYDSYDKLDHQMTGAQFTPPDFVIVLIDVDGVLQVNAAATWMSNAANWRASASQIAEAHPSRDWSEAQWQSYFSTVLNHAALARYCNQADELQQLLSAVNPQLDADQRRLLADTLSKIVPLEKPKAWRVPY